MIKHFAATAYIVAKIDGEFKVLLHKHKKLKIWIGVGGHVEKGESPKEAVIREAKEETNLEITLVNQFGIQEEKIPKYKNQAAHRHIDFIYFAFAKNPENIRMKEKYDWFSAKDLDKMNLQEEAKKAAENAVKIFRA